MMEEEEEGESRYRHTEEGDALIEMRILDSTRKAYEGKLKIIRAGLRDVAPDVFSKKTEGDADYIDLQNLAWKDLREAILRDRNPDNSHKTYHVYKKHQSAISHVAKEQGEVMPKLLAQELEIFISGLRKKFAAQKKRGEVKAHAKDIIPVELIHTLMAEALTKGDLKSIQWNAYLHQQYTLAARAISIQDLCFRAGRIFKDSVTWRFDQTKPDQEGKHIDDKHTYANTSRPEICNHLALGIYLLVNPSLNTNTVFGGGREMTSAFSKWLQDALKSDKAERVMIDAGIVRKDVGSHSVRKVARNELATGAVLISKEARNCRAGVSNGKNTDPYVGGGGEADCRAGRTLAGLNFTSDDAAALPPHFYCKEEADAKFVDSAVQRCFPGPSKIGDIRATRAYLKRYLASCVFHAEWMQKTFPTEHCVFSSLLFTEAGLLEKLRPLVCTGTLYNIKSAMASTGVPPYVIQGISARLSAQCQKELAKQIEQDRRDRKEEQKNQEENRKKQLLSSEDRILKGVKQILAEDGRTSDTATMSSVRSFMADELSKLHRAIQSTNAIQTTGTQNAMTQQEEATTEESRTRTTEMQPGITRLYNCPDGTMKRIPPGCACQAIPREANMATVYRLWFQPNQVLQSGNLVPVPPLQKISPGDIYIANDGTPHDENEIKAKRRLTVIKKVLRVYVDTSEIVFTQNPTTEKINGWFHQTITKIEERLPTLKRNRTRATAKRKPVTEYNRLNKAGLTPQGGKRKRRRRCAPGSGRTTSL